jgi:SAM-dependent methyltransferase
MSNKETGAEFDSYAEAYREHVAKALPPGVGEVDAFARVKVWHLVRAIDSVFPGRRDVRLLDAGCGIGLTDRYLKSVYPNITGFDVSPKSVELAAKANPELSYRCDPSGQLPFEDAGFDVVFAICVVHHVPPAEWLTFFQQLHRVMKPEGLLAIYEHNPWNPATQWVVSRCEFDRDAALLNSSRCSALAAEAGFSAPRARNLLFLPLESETWCSWERRLFSRLPIGAQYEFTARK